MGEVKLHGFWYSPFTMRVVWTLKLKGIEYENIEEDRFNKSPQLLEYNPVHKKVPVLVHNGKPICESMIIVEYIDQIWPQNPLLPADPYDRALARFWSKYTDDTVSSLVAFYRSNNSEEKEKIKEKLRENFGVVENHCFEDQRKFFGGDTINITDIAFGSLVKYILIAEDVLQVKILETEKFPHLHAWFENFRNVPAIAENLPEQEKIVAFAKILSQKHLPKKDRSE